MEPHEVNPYAAPEVAAAIPAEAVSEPEAIRLQHLRYETTVQTIGSLYLVGGLFWVLVFIVGLPMLYYAIAHAGRGTSSPTDDLVAGIVAIVVIVSISTSLLAVGRGLLLLRSWTIIPACLLAGLMLLMFPIGTALGMVCLVALALPKTRYVLSREYQAIIQQTPHIRRKTSVLVFLIAGIAIFIFVMGIVGLFLV